MGCLAGMFLFVDEPEWDNLEKLDFLEVNMRGYKEKLEIPFSIEDSFTVVYERECVPG